MDRVHEIVGSKIVHLRGIRGRQVGIAILDTGITMHPDFDNRILVFKDFVNNKNWMYDDYGHGTHIAGIAAGSGRVSKGKYCGIAPEADIIALKVLDFRGNGNIPTLMRALDWILTNRVRYHIQIVNISVGTIENGNAGEDSDLVRAVNQVWDSGIVVCVAAGNNGPGEGTVTTPGISRKVITVGSSEGMLAADYSGRGPNASCIIKPDLVAPGSNICSCKSIRRNFPAMTQESQYYTRKSGTSMATPIVSGAVALLLSQYPSCSNMIVKRRLCETAYDMGVESRRQGFGQVNIGQFVLNER